MVDVDEIAATAIADLPPPPPIVELDRRVRRRRRRRRFAGVTAAIMSLAGAAFAARGWVVSEDHSIDVVTDTPDWDGSHRKVPDAYLGPDPCSPILFVEDPEINQLRRAGLPDAVPEFLIDRFHAQGVSCWSGGNSADLVVEAVSVRFWSGDTLVAQWFIPGTPHMAGRTETWPEYFRWVSGVGDVEELGDGFISVSPSEHESAIRSEIAQMTGSDYVSLWRVLANR